MNRLPMIALLVAAIPLIVFQPRHAAAGAPMKAAPGVHDEASGNPGPSETPEFENDRVRVVRMHLGPHEKILMHLLPDHLVIWLTGARLKMTFPDGKNSQARFRPGQVIWVGAQKHAGENLTDKPIDFLAVFLKKDSQPDAEPGG